MLWSDLNPFNVGSPACRFVDFRPHSAQHCRTFRNGIPSFNSMQCAIDNFLLITSENAVKCTAHADVADVRTAPHQLLISGLNMRVRADDHDAPIGEHLRERFLLARRFTMEIYEPQIGGYPVQNFAHALKRTAYDIVHEHLATQIDHSDLLSIGPGDTHAFAQLNRSQINRPDQTVGFLNKHF